MKICTQQDARHYCERLSNPLKYDRKIRYACLDSTILSMARPRCLVFARSGHMPLAREALALKPKRYNIVSDFLSPI